jgi:hypothetical protein
MKLYNEGAVLVATICLGSQISGNARLRLVEIFKELFCRHGKRRLGFFQIA